MELPEKNGRYSEMINCSKTLLYTVLWKNTIPVNPLSWNVESDSWGKMASILGNI